MGEPQQFHGFVSNGKGKGSGKDGGKGSRKGGKGKAGFGGGSKGGKPDTSATPFDSDMTDDFQGKRKRQNSGGKGGKDSRPKEAWGEEGNSGFAANQSLGLNGFPADGGKGGGGKGGKGGGKGPSKQRVAAPPLREHSQGKMASFEAQAAAAAAAGPRFSGLPLHPLTMKAIQEVLGHDTMTPVQAQTLPHILQGKDVLGKAKTGTGKTLAFLIPTVERMLKSQQTAVKGAFYALCLTSSRELANQIAVQAEKLVSLHKLNVTCMVGGINIKKDYKALGRQIDILVATPGRLNDHIATTEGFAQRLQGIHTLILDEGDQLLDQGFAPDIKKIIAHLPTVRQSLCFSATVPPSLGDVVGAALRRDYHFEDCVGEEADTHSGDMVEQSFAVTTIEHAFLLLYANLVHEMQTNPEHKVIVFLPTARETQLVAELLNAAGVRALEIHSRKSQAQRNKVSDEFRTARAAVLLSSDVSARGVDYPDVTLVVQVGAPSGREQYVHRLGRTARAGKKGRGILLLSNFEQFFLKNIQDLPVADACAEMEQVLSAQVVQQQYAPTLARAMTRVDEKTKSMAYQAWLGYYNSSKKQLRWNNAQLVEMANHYATAVLLLPSPPALQAKTVGKMGLKGTPGLVIERWAGN